MMHGKLLKKYKKNYERLAKENIEKDIMPIQYKQEQSLKLMRYLPDLTDKIVLDLGCSKGLFLDYVKECKFKCGVDISYIYCQYTKNKGIPTVCLNAEKLPFYKAFDVIVATDILEHVIDLQATIKSIHQALKRDGILLIRVPYKEDISKYSKEKGYKYDFGHLRNFDEEDIKTAISNYFEVINFHYDGFVYYGTKFRGIFQKILHKTFGKVIDLLYDGRWEIMPNWLGNLICQPVEMVAVVKKV